MDFAKALEITLDLALENIIDERDCLDEVVENARREAIEATNRVRSLLDVVKGINCC